MNLATFTVGTSSFGSNLVSFPQKILNLGDTADRELENILYYVEDN